MSSVQTQLESVRNLTTDDFIKTDSKQSPTSPVCENEVADRHRILKKRKRGRRPERPPLKDIKNKLVEHQPIVQKETKRARVDDGKLINCTIILKDGTITPPSKVYRNQFNTTIRWKAIDPPQDQA